MEQRSDEWFDARGGRVTASRIADVAARTKSGWGASRANYMAELIVYQLTGERPGFGTPAMRWGTETEPQARLAYEFLTGRDVEECGFYLHPEIERSGASPDGLVGDDGLLEIKCPNTSTHIDTLLSRKVPHKYLLQMQWQMACTGRQWCDFMSFDPRMPADLQSWITRVERDDDLITSLAADVVEFIAEMDQRLEELRRIAA